jgi:hypothetical protein
MRHERHPPACATWLLERFSGRYRRDALLGDLLEEYRRGRSDAWYWREAMVAVMTAGHSRLCRAVPGLAVLLCWWSTVVVLAFIFKTAVPLLLILDPSVFWFLKRSRRKRTQRS